MCKIKDYPYDRDNKYAKIMAKEIVDDLINKHLSIGEIQNVLYLTHEVLQNYRFVSVENSQEPVKEHVIGDHPFFIKVFGNGI